MPNTNEMKTEQKVFWIWLPSETGFGWIEKKASSFRDAFLKLSQKDRMKDGWIEDHETEESKTFCEILGIEETL